MIQIAKQDPSLASPSVPYWGGVGTWLTIPSDNTGQLLAEEDGLEAEQLTKNVLAFLENDDSQVQRL